MIAYTEKQLAAFKLERHKNWKKWQASMDQAALEDWLTGTKHHVMQWMNNYYALGLSPEEISHFAKNLGNKS